MHRKFFIIVAVFAFGLFVAGCDKAVTDVDADQSAIDRQEILATIEGDALFTGDGQMLNDDDLMNLGKTSTEIFPRAWGRRISSVTRSVTFDEQDTIVIATVTTTLTGNVLIRARYSLQDTLQTFVKPFTENLTRKAKFYRNPTSGGKRWLMREVSAVKGGTVNEGITITRIDLIAGTDTVSITDPNAFFMRMRGFGGREVPTVLVNQEAKVRVSLTTTAAAGDTDLVAIHRPMMGPGGTLRAAHARMVLVEANGSARVYQYIWTPQMPGYHHVFVTAVTRESIFDDVAPYASNVWGVPFFVNN